MAVPKIVPFGLALIASVSGGEANARVPHDPLLQPVDPVAANQWLVKQPPLHIYGNTYLVGFAGLNVGLIKTRAGLILIDGALPQGVPAIEANIKALGFRVRDVRYILSTEPHFDHASGIGALARDSHAVVIAGKAAVQALETGRPSADDPQAAYHAHYHGVGPVRGVSDGATIRLGGVTVTAVATPGHTPGSTSWSWQSCERGDCKAMVFASSLNPIAADFYLFTGPEHQGLADAFRQSFATMRALPCDILISAHPDQSGGDVKAVQLRAGTDPNPFLDPGACRAFADRFEALFDKRIADEKAGRVK
ncbi:MAG TPA: subclass B3 metallo-beta-lactamase [Sphingomonas sp.]|uniref:subclass B3 metallo-beta-lactamase n=1 Tax=Sphingomonas sp. TaxID=28214 RepID=UPI002B983E35|nr:subclass B3 metallo-beta-lactamase [Sphingomonas sp.]HMI18639.1 subclass B3 metallo-beta-lactamase [Sphingomonas sp.]